MTFPSHTILPCTPLDSVTLQKVGEHSTTTPSMAEWCWVCTAWMERLCLCPEETCRRDHEWKVRKLFCPWLRILASLAGWDPAWQYYGTGVLLMWGGTAVKSSKRKFQEERSSLKWFYSSCQILLNKECLITFSQRSGNLSLFSS